MDKIKKTDHFYLIDGSGYIFSNLHKVNVTIKHQNNLDIIIIVKKGKFFIYRFYNHCNI